MKTLISLICFFWLFNISLAEEPLRTWTSSDGRTLKARFIKKVGSSSVKIENATGKEFTLPQSRISAADWKYVEDVVAEKKEKEVKEEIFRLPKSLSSKGCVIIASLNGNVEVFDNPSEEGSFGGSYINGKYVEPREAKGRKPKVGESIETGGVIITKANSQAVLLLTNGTLATLNENSRVVLENLWQTPFKAFSKKVSELKEEPSQSRTALGLDFGELIVDVKKLNNSSSFLVHTPLGVAGIRGTQFRFNSQNNGTTLSVTEGLVEYLDPKRKFFSVGKENLVTTEADKSSKPGELDENEKNRINNVILKASQSAASYDLRKLFDAFRVASQRQKSFIVESAKNLEMIWCPPGSYFRGEGSSSNNVILTKGFYLGKYEVTQEQYQSVMGTENFPPAQTSYFKGPKLPEENVSWEDAMAFCKKLSEKEKGRIPVDWEFTLPTESQWEYACRAGTTTKYSWGDEIDTKLANYDPSTATVETPGLLRDKGLNTSAVGSYRPNPWGFYDMHGNVGEWCADWYGKYPSGLVTDPVGVASGSLRVFRGGSFWEKAMFLRSAERHSRSPGNRVTSLGFRVGFQKIK